ASSSPLHLPRRLLPSLPPEPPPPAPPRICGCASWPSTAVPDLAMAIATESRDNEEGCDQQQCGCDAPAGMHEERQTRPVKHDGKSPLHLQPCHASMPRICSPRVDGDGDYGILM
ncbi:unnamed protein product, partial [Urochloa humidicola]